MQNILGLKWKDRDSRPGIVWYLMCAFGCIWKVLDYPYLEKEDHNHHFPGWLDRVKEMMFLVNTLETEKTLCEGSYSHRFHCSFVVYLCIKTSSLIWVQNDHQILRPN